MADIVPLNRGSCPLQYEITSAVARGARSTRAPAVPQLIQGTSAGGGVPCEALHAAEGVDDPILSDATTRRYCTLLATPAC